MACIGIQQQSQHWPEARPVDTPCLIALGDSTAQCMHGADNEKGIEKHQAAALCPAQLPGEDGLVADVGIQQQTLTGRRSTRTYKTIRNTKPQPSALPNLLGKMDWWQMSAFSSTGPTASNELAIFGVLSPSLDQLGSQGSGYDWP